LQKQFHNGEKFNRPLWRWSLQRIARKNVLNVVNRVLSISQSTVHVTLNNNQVEIIFTFEVEGDDFFAILIWVFTLYPLWMDYHLL